MFRGNHECQVDEKGRVPFPARFREVLSQAGQNVLVLTRGFSPCIHAFPLKEWLKLEERLGQMPVFDPNVQRMRRLLLGECAECELDKQGRILVPPRLRDYAGVGKDAVFVGQMQTVEIWSSDGWKRHWEELVADTGGVQSAVATFGL
ncbi:MAG: division/cell wall cluster transcriptional repressor MraZ [Deltaproteobacteria bacterium]|nr:division/cell wall cluster transcriptional repressor MraZ [Deltaproteobacteria bacterium]